MKIVASAVKQMTYMKKKSDSYQIGRHMKIKQKESFKLMVTGTNVLEGKSRAKFTRPLM